MADPAQDAEVVLRAIPLDNEEALVAMVRVMRVLAASQGYLDESTLFALWLKEKRHAHEAERRVIAHHEIGTLSREVLVEWDGGPCPICTRADMGIV